MATSRCRITSLQMWILTITLTCYLIRGEYADERRPKLGRCPALIDANSDLCKNNVSECASDLGCSGREKCCHDGCSNVCTQPIYSACEHQLLASEKRARALDDEATVSTKCRAGGEFESVQCDWTRECWCVDAAGFELAGTRTNQSESINCSAPRLCSGVMCRMLCPYDFALDETGCPMCQCRDPCSGVKCPGTQKCHLEDVICDSDPCPPVASCKQARFLDSVCPSGEPLYLNEKSQPFLCGLETNKPQCPPFFTCVVEDSMEYGACCPSLDKIEKPGKCPQPSSSDTECGTKCNDDSNCMGLLKCCPSDKCQSHCVPSNSTICEQQRMLAELLSRNERSDRGYVPQCDDSGLFEYKQCSRNGLVCWCVDKNGNKLPRTMGAAANVSCSDDADGVPSSDCHDVMCRAFCEYGFKTDENGCQTCDCADPCDGYPCPAGEECVTTYGESCIDSFCPSVPECKAIAQPDIKSGVCPSAEKLGCVNDSATCAGDETCPEDEKCCRHLCGSSCAKPIQTPSRLPTMCEFLRAHALSVVDSPEERTLAYSIPQCTKEGLFESIQCSEDVCWCVDEFGVELPRTRGSNKDVVDCTSAQPRDGCFGLMCRLGCDYGFVRDESGCPVCECRNPCDVMRCPESMRCQMFEVEKTCNGGFCPPIPQCVTKAKSFSVCPVGDSLINPDTNETWICESDADCTQNYSCYANNHEILGICCPTLDSELCKLPKDTGSCEALIERWFYNAATSRCESFVFGGCGGNLNNFPSRDECEKACVVNVDSPPKEGSCPAVSEDEVGSCAEECKNDAECNGPQKCCLNGCGAHVCRDPAGTAGKLGQCPYLVPVTSENCDFECKSDFDCDGQSKCCSNGCGTNCVDAVHKTGCEHLRAIGEYLAREKGIPAKQMFIVSCQSEDGSFSSVQCLNNKTCWCVDKLGQELPGTRTQVGEPDCSAPRVCPTIECELSCPNGFQLNDVGCPTCACQDPCADISCSVFEECRIVPINCVAEPCPLVPMCLPKLDNPCPEGEPLREVVTRNVIRCGPEGESCPSSHKCHLSPLGEFAVCCRKPRDVCNLPEENGRCMAAIPRWFFNSSSDKCQEFMYGGCGGNLNNFQTETDCRIVCPAMSSCEQMREKNKNLIRHYNKDIFIPKCNPITGAWEPMQCLPSLGLCWCVSRDGEQQSGSLVRGIPQCSARVGRTFAESNLSSICDGGEDVHVCDPELCANKICLSQPDAICQIDPCGGCTPKFFNATGHTVDCVQGLTQCQLEMQKVMNSMAWLNQDASLPVAVLKDLPELDLSDDEADSNFDESVRKRRDLVTSTLSFLSNLMSDASETHEEVALPAITTENPTSTLPPLPELPMEALLMGVTIPQCTNKGRYSPTQSTGILSWCVTPDGQPVDSTLSRGSIQCSDKGDVILREESLEVCPNGEKKAQVCKDECLTAYCSAHPDAVCLADPCNNCKVSFYSKKGDIVLCEDKCSQPKEIGICRAAYRRYYYNRTTQLCEQFIYGGCGGTDNNFASKEDCTQQCSQPVNICEQPKRVGMCRAIMRRWYFNQHTHSCEEFIFGGCDGNDNNFETKEECEARCPDLVLCPFSNLVEMQQPCSRRLVCNGVTCPYRDDVVCTIDPCDNSTAMFVDLDGLPVSCEPDTTTTVSSTEEKSTTQATTVEIVSSTDEILPYIPISKLTRCQKEQLTARAWSERAPSCDSHGRFNPTQCDDDIVVNEVEVMCWCVDEAGNQLPNANRFLKGTRICKPRKIDFVRVKLVFQFDPAEELDNQTHLLRRAMTSILERVEARTSDIIIQIQHGTVVVQFYLIGENKVDAAFALEEMLKYGIMKLLIGQKTLRPLPASSSFYHALSDYQDDDTFELSATTVAAILIFTFLTLVLICALIGGVMVYRKRRMGMYPRGSMESLASSTSPLYNEKMKGTNLITNPFTPSEKKLKISSVENDYAILSVTHGEKKNPIV